MSTQDSVAAGCAEVLRERREVDASGLYLGEFNALLLQKIEELTLYAIEQGKVIGEMKADMRRLKE